ncbi:MAG: hypothetical protein KDE28_20945, partial [Anaerolineales bacterium]|nr:hypothetical protein [Anaerolineales bacterium]
SKPDGQTACRANCSLAPLCRVTRESIAKWQRQS